MTSAMTGMLASLLTCQTVKTLTRLSTLNFYHSLILNQVKVKVAGAVSTSTPITSNHDPSPITACVVMVDGQAAPLPGTHWHYGISHPGGIHL